MVSKNFGKDFVGEITQANGLKLRDSFRIRNLWDKDNLCGVQQLKGSVASEEFISEALNIFVNNSLVFVIESPMESIRT